MPVREQNIASTYMKRSFALRRTFIALAAFAFNILFAAQSIRANSATWSANPNSGDWNDPGNWTPMTVPNGAADTATFSVSNQTSLFFNAFTMQLASIVFDTGASVFTITDDLSVVTIGGAGIVNNSGSTQSFVLDNHSSMLGAIIRFTNSATAGLLATFTNNGGAISGGFGGYTEFFDNSMAGQAQFITNGGFVSGARGGGTLFYNASSAANATFLINGGAAANAIGGSISFFDASTAGSGTFTANAGSVSGTKGNHTSGGTVTFTSSSSAGSGNFTTNGSSVADAFGGDIVFQQNASAANGTFANNGSSVATAASGGRTRFFDSSTAGSAVLIANGGSAGGNGGSILFSGDSTGGTALPPVQRERSLARSRPD